MAPGGKATLNFSAADIEAVSRAMATVRGQTIERKDVGITLRIWPQIGENGKVRMTIFQESSSVASTSTSSGRTTHKRSIESTVSVQDGKIIVRGGLIEDSCTSDAASIPGLSHIPWLGALFRSLSKTRKKSNLVVFLRPGVMPDAAAVAALSLGRHDVIQAQQRSLPEGVTGVLPGASLPALPGDAGAVPLPQLAHSRGRCLGRRGACDENAQRQFGVPT